MKVADTSKSSVYRLINKYPHLKKQTKLVSNRKLIPLVFRKYFNMDLMIEDEKRLLDDSNDKKQLIDLILENPNKANFFWKMDWDLFVTVSYKNEMTSLACHNKMTKLFHNLQHYNEHESSLRMLFTTEEYGVRDGRHNHFVLHSTNKSIIPAIELYIKEQFSFDHVYIDDYNKYKPGVHYICKDGLQGDSWDYLH
ncbi:hypothetical protein [Christiangramia portivictoriae]|uniref:hypothetical protein n=1 Tax=Christiangramia portivictoriae TaxID=326069 RepID=UPI0012F74747|nr:hypothetical protein [Christiangramia portivictoriae]